MSKNGNLASNIRAERARKGWSQTELADVAKISRLTVSNLERGQTTTVDTLDKLADAFGVTTDYLIGRDDK